MSADQLHCYCQRPAFRVSWKRLRKCHAIQLQELVPARVLYQPHDLALVQGAAVLQDAFQLAFPKDAEVQAGIDRYFSAVVLLAHEFVRDARVDRLDLHVLRALALGKSGRRDVFLGATVAFLSPRVRLIVFFFCHICYIPFPATPRKTSIFGHFCGGEAEGRGSGGVFLQAFEILITEEKEGIAVRIPVVVLIAFQVLGLPDQAQGVGNVLALTHV